MRRREFLTMGAAVAASPLVSVNSPKLARAAVPAFVRRWDGPPNRFDIVLTETTLAVDCLAPDMATGPQTVGGEDPSEALVTVGPRRQPVSWALQRWEEPDPFTRRLVLRARGDRPLLADVTFVFDQRSGLVTRRTELRNLDRSREIDIRATLGLLFRIHEPVGRVVYLAGGWEEEAQIQHESPGEKPLLLESRVGKTGFELQPYAALRTASGTYVCQIFWSGNWALQILPRNDGAAVLGGLNNWRFRHRLRAGDPLVLPTVQFGRVDGSPAVAARHLHDYLRARRPNPDRFIPVQFNSWYPYQGDPTADALLPLLPIVKHVGCEAFVIDAGWYRTDGGESEGDWKDRTGDWRVSRRHFPRGLQEISQRCRELGLKLGLWFEPEVIAPSSSIRRDHPEWLHHIGGRLPPDYERAVLHLGVTEAWQHVFDRITDILRGAQVQWMKWDFNADLLDGGWAPTLPRRLIGQSPLVAHYRGLYRMQDAIRAAFPDLVLEMCAAGGGRMDNEILSHAHVNWISDQMGALRKLAMHFGAQLAYPAVTCNDWLIDWVGSDKAEIDGALVDPRGDLAFRLRVAMLGSFGISAPIDRWPDADIEIARQHVAFYKKIRPIIHHGDQYFLTPPPPPDGNGDWAAIWYVAKDGSAGILFAFRLAGPYSGRVFRLPGLRGERRYRVSSFSGETAVRSGEDLGRGRIVMLGEMFRSELYFIEALPDQL